MRLEKAFRSFLMASASVSVLSIGTVSYAQEIQENSKDKTGSTRLLRIVKGAGQDKVATDTPQAVTVLEQADIDEVGATTIGDTFDQIPGVTTSGSERVLGESFNIRGIGSGEDQADEGRFIISVDGVDKNYQQYRMGGFFSDPELYKRVEVLRGPASSTLYGSGALAGTVLFTTKDASDFLQEGQKAAVRLKMAFEDNSHQTLATAIYAFRASENAEFLLNSNYRIGGDYDTGDGTEIDADFDSFSGLAKGTFYFGEGNEQVLRASYEAWNSGAKNQQYAQTVDSSGFGRVDRDVTSEQYLIAWENPDSDNDLINLKAQISLSNTLTEERNGTVFFFGPGPGVQFFKDADFLYRTWQAKIENTAITSGENWESYFTVGAQYTNLNRSVGLLDKGAQPEGVDEKFGLFAQSELTINERLILTPGMRIDWRTITPDEGVNAGFAANGAQSTSATGYSPKLTALYKLNDNWNVFGSFAHTERLATIDEIYDYRAGTTQGADKKERSDNFEIGFSYSTDGILEGEDTFQFKTTAFHNSIQDFIARDSNNTTGTSAYYNLDEVTLVGIEAEFAYDAPTWFVSGGASLLRGEYVRGDVQVGATANTNPNRSNLNTVPGDELFFKIGGKFVDDGLSYGWKSRFVSGQDRVDAAPNKRLTTSGFATHGAFINWVPEKDGYNGFELRASVENIFDKQYNEFLSQDSKPGRTFKFSFVKHFGS